MANLTIRNLDESLKSRLRVRAASRGRSMEDEVRHILRAALNETSTAEPDLAQRIRRRFAGLGDVQLLPAAREPVREPPVVEDRPTPAVRDVSRIARPVGSRRRT